MGPSLIERGRGGLLGLGDRAALSRSLIMTCPVFLIVGVEVEADESGLGVGPPVLRLRSPGVHEALKSGPRQVDLNEGVPRRVPAVQHILEKRIFKAGY